MTRTHRWISRLRLKLRSLFIRRTVEHELDEEMRFHLGKRIEENIATGMEYGDARTQALRDFGGMAQVKEECRDARGLNLVENLVKDIRFALRVMGRNPGFAITIVLTMALGIGVNTALFSVFNAVALRPLPVREPGHVVRMKRWFDAGGRNLDDYRFSYQEYRYIREHSDLFEGVVTASSATPVLLDSQKFLTELVSANYFEVLGIRPRLGRTFLPDEDRTPGGNPVIVLSHSSWMRRFNGDPTVIGKTLKSRDAVFTVIGVASEEFTGTILSAPVIPDFWAPVSMQAQLGSEREWLNSPNASELQILARLKPGTSMKAAQAQSSGLARQHASTLQGPWKTTSITVERPTLFGDMDDVSLAVAGAVLMVIVGLVLIVACANVANMVLAHGAGRQREIGIRLAIGASRSRIVRQLLTESIVLAFAGGFLGLALATWTTKILWKLITERFANTLLGGLTVSLNLNPDTRVFIYTFVISIAAGVLFGLLPAIQITNPELAGSLKDGGGLFGHRIRHSRTRRILITAQVTISVLFLIVSGLLMRGVMRSGGIELGYNTRDVYVIAADFGKDAQRVERVQRVSEAIQSLPEVKALVRGHAPLFGTWTTAVSIDGRTDRTLASYASDRYFEALGIGIVRGRPFSAQEAREGAPVAIVSESTARYFWPGQDPLLKRFKVDLGKAMQEYEVVGIARDVRFANPTRIDPAHIFLATRSSDSNALILRTQGNRDRALTAVRGAMESVDGNLSASLEFHNLEQGPLTIHKLFSRGSAVFTGTLALLALSFASIGIYGVMAHLIGQRTKEIGIRMALGATSRNVLRNVVFEGLSPVLLGIGLGFTGSLILSWLLHKRLVFPESSDLLYGAPFYDPVAFIGLSAFVTLVAVLASWTPARRAIRVDPVIALRHD